MDIEFDGLNKGDRLFLPDDFDGSGQILVTPMEELRKKYKVKMKDKNLYNINIRKMRYEV